MGQGGGQGLVLQEDRRPGKRAPSPSSVYPLPPSSRRQRAATCEGTVRLGTGSRDDLSPFSQAHLSSPAVSLCGWSEGPPLLPDPTADANVLQRVEGSDEEIQRASVTGPRGLNRTPWSQGPGRLRVRGQVDCPRSGRSLPPWGYLAGPLPEGTQPPLPKGRSSLLTTPLPSHSCSTSYKSEAPMTLARGSIVCQKDSQTSRRRFTFLADRKGCHSGQQMEERPRARPEGGHGATTSSPAQDVSTNLEALELCSSGIFTNTSSQSHDRPILTLWRVWRGRSKAPASQPGAGDHSHPEGVPEATQSHLLRTKDAPLTQEIRRSQEPGQTSRIHPIISPPSSPKGMALPPSAWPLLLFCSRLHRDPQVGQKACVRIPAHRPQL